MMDTQIVNRRAAEKMEYRARMNMASRLRRHALIGLLLYGGFAGEIAASEPCCNITAIDKKTGIVTAQDAKTKRAVQFKVDNAVLLNKIALNQKVDVDLQAGRASIEGTQGRFRIVSAPTEPALRAAPGATPRSPSAPPTDRSRAPDACCTITAINAKSGVVTARETATGRSFTFAVSDAGVLRGLRAGQPVHAHFGSKQVSLDGRKPCCQIANLATDAKPTLPTGRTTPPLPGTKGTGSAGAGMNSGVPAESGTNQSWPQNDPAAGMPSDSTFPPAQDGYGQFPTTSEPPADYGSAFPSDAQGSYPADSGYPADTSGSGYYPGQQPGMTTAPQPQDGGKGFSYGTGEAPIQGDIPWWKQQLPQQ
jgi:hypothetical protein